MNLERFEQLKESLKKTFPDASTDNIPESEFTQEQLWTMYTSLRDMNILIDKYPCST